MAQITIPTSLLPQDGRFGCGPSLIRPKQLEALLSSPELGSSHRQAPVKNLVGSVRSGLAQLFNLPDGYEIILGNGGATAFWDALIFSVITNRSQHLTFGEFGAKFATASQQAPWLNDPEIITAPPGSRAEAHANTTVDVYAWPHNETSTGVWAPVQRVANTTEGALTVIDATSAAAGINFDAAQADIYYFSPQKNFGSDGGLWLAALSPAAISRIESVTATRYIPETLNLHVALTNSRANQTLNTPAISTLVLLNEQIKWLLERGGLSASAAHTVSCSNLLYTWAEQHSYANPFVTNPEHRSPVVATIDFDDNIDAKMLCAILRAHNIRDTEPYRKLGRNQIRVATFASTAKADVEALITCIEYVLERI